MEAQLCVHIRTRGSLQLCVYAHAQRISANLGYFELVGSCPAWHLQGKELDSKQINGAQDTNGAVADSSAPQVARDMRDGQQMPEQVQVPSHTAVVPLTDEALAQRNPFEGAAEANGVLSTAEADSAGAKQAGEPAHPPPDAADRAKRQEMQQNPEENSRARAVPRLKIPLSPRPASARELPGSRAAQADSSAKSRGHRSEQLPDEGWSPRQVRWAVPCCCRTSSAIGQLLLEALPVGPLDHGWHAMLGFRYSVGNMQCPQWALHAACRVPCISSTHHS